MTGGLVVSPHPPVTQKLMMLYIKEGIQIDNRLFSRYQNRNINFKRTFPLLFFGKRRKNNIGKVYISTKFKGLITTPLILTQCLAYLNDCATVRRKDGIKF